MRSPTNHRAQRLIRAWLIACLVGVLAVPLGCRRRATPGDEAADPPSEQATPDSEGATAGEPAKRTEGRRRAMPRPTWDTSKPAAPSRKGFGVNVGALTLAEAKAHTAAIGVDCQDASPATLVKRMKERRRAELAAEGASPDAVSSASANRPSAHERIEQIRWSCNQTASKALTDIARGASTGRLLMVFDSARHPLRHVSFQRTHDDPAAAMADFLATAAGYQARLGDPHIVQHDLPATAPDGFLFPKLTHVLREWQYGDLRVKVDALSRNGSTVVLYEVVEVPAAVPMSPLADAPSPPAATAPAPAAGSGAPKPTRAP